MKHFIVILFLFCFILKVNCQSVHFENLTWQQAISTAKKENKMVFVDVYTTWCTYCKQMEQNVFTDAATARFYNTHFINVKCDAQQPDGIGLRKSYALLGFPTFLYLDANGIAILKTAGYQQTEVFIRNADSAFILQQNKMQLHQVVQL